MQVWGMRNWNESIFFFFFFFTRAIGTPASPRVSVGDWPVNHIGGFSTAGVFGFNAGGLPNMQSACVNSKGAARDKYRPRETGFFLTNGNWSFEKTQSRHASGSAF